MRVALYARVSSEQQAERDLSIPAQIKLMRDYARQQGHEVVREALEPGESATTADRPAFQELVAEAKLHPAPFDAILVWKLSRFARNREDAVVYKSLLRRRGIQVISVSEPIDDSPTGRLLEGIIETVDEFYSLNLGQDVRRGKRQVAEQGGWNGSRPPDGYAVTKEHGIRRLVLDRERAPIIRRIFEFARRGESSTAIARQLNSEGVRNRDGRRWQQASISRLLRNEVYTGVIIYRQGEMKVPDAHEALIDAETFAAVRAAVEAKNPELEHPRRATSPYVLSGLIVCARCGASWTGCRSKNQQGRVYRYYICSSRRGERGSGGEGCSTPSVPQRRLEAAVISQVQAALFSESRIQAILGRVRDRVRELAAAEATKTQELRSRCAGLQRRRDNLLAGVEEGAIPLAVAGDRLKAVAGELQAAEAALAETEAATQAEDLLPTLADIARYVTRLGEVLGEGTPAERRQWLKAVIACVETDGRAVAVSYRFPGLDPSRLPIDASASIGALIGARLKIAFVLEDIG